MSLFRPIRYRHLRQRIAELEKLETEHQQQTETSREAKASLRESEERYRLVVENANEAILVVIEPAEVVSDQLSVSSDQSSVIRYQRPAPEVALAEPHRTPAPWRTKVVPVVGAALAFLGREVAPRLATYLVDALDRRQARQLTLRQTQDVTKVSPTDSIAPVSGGKGGQKGRRRRHRRRGK